MAYIWQETFYNMKRSKPACALSMFIVALTAIILYILLTVLYYLDTELDSIKSSPFIVAFLTDGFNEANIPELKAKIESIPGIRSIRYVSKDEALRTSARMFANWKEILNGLEQVNPFPRSFEITVEEKYLNKVAEISKEIATMDGIEDVQHAEQISNFVRTIQVIILFVASALGIASILITWFSIIITAYVGRKDIEVIRLVGGTSAYIRIPLLLQGLLQGLIGGLIGITIFYGTLYLLAELDQLEIDLITLSLSTWRQFSAVIGVTALIGFVGGAIPLRKIVKL